MNILLTGSEGYIGSVMLPLLVKAGHRVRGLDSGFFADGALYKTDKPDYQLIKKDTRNIEKPDLADIDTVIHLAELSNDPLGQIDPDLTIKINHGATKRFIDLAKAQGINRFLYSSSCSVYGASDSVSDENSATNPLTAYARAKILNERYLLSQKSASFHPTIFRNATVYGPSPRMRFDLAVNNLAGVAYTTKVVKLTSDGQAWRPFVHVTDLCQAFIKALDTDIQTVSGQILNVGDSNSNYRIVDVAKIISEVFGVSEMTRDTSSSDNRNYRISFAKIARLVKGFTCSYTVRSGAEELKQLFDKIKLNQNTFESELYTRLKKIRRLKSDGLLNDELFFTA